MEAATYKKDYRRLSTLRILKHLEEEYIISLYHITSHPRCLIGAEEEYKGSYTTFMFSSFNILLSCFYVL